VVVLGRGLVGGVFLLAGFSKVLLPQAEVAALIQQYTVLPAAIIPLIATLLPWLELASGTALLIGFYTTLAAGIIGAQLVMFIALMLVVLGLGIPIEDCGCFGNFGWSETPLQVLIRDLVLLALLVPVLARQRDVLSLDAWGEPPASQTAR
jgi:uncharacterized membrane protein YphA (DoxX/SURF4 family)